MIPVGIRLCIGGPVDESIAAKNPYWNYDDPTQPRCMQMHSLMWERIKTEAPEFAAKCDVFKIVGEEEIRISNPE